MNCNIEISALIENWHIIYDFLNQCIDKWNIQYKFKTEILLSCEEIYVNVSNYAYSGKVGSISIRISFDEPQGEIKIKFTDSGIPFDPTKLKNPNIGDPIEKRKIGGLGVFMVKEMMDGMKYYYESGKNNLVLTKKV